MIKVGIGYDAHQLAEGHSLIVGGVSIPSKIGSVGHSDGDALVHSIVDALLGAASLGDIGTYFPSDDEKWKDTDSKYFLSETATRIREAGFEIRHIDCVVILQSPKLNEHIPAMRYQIAYTLQIDESAVSIKATTTDYLGYIGEGKGWATQAIATIATR
ncbi:MAG: 2-C-methyl-D-erythritol 2,4-cyclodiphosphate synthase [Candidatus Marinimicrobia bacterium]|nr:2-C-methyl-D-erythritol 2,4-cyclodiphosphate synthase [Candidatus Neomarinimicrobiota bacterium]